MTENNGIFIAFGIACGAFLSAYQAKRFNHDPEIIYYLFLPLTVWGFIGARLWHIFTPPLSAVQLGLTTQHYLSHPLDVIAVWVGGLGIPGAILGSGLALFIFCLRYKQPFWQITDILAPGLVLAQIIGRVANYLNQELYGLPTSLPWGIFIELPNRLIGYEAIEFYHPLFVYEMILNTVNLILILWLANKISFTWKTGNIFLTYIAFYSFIRFLLEFIRLDVALINQININQIFFASLFLIAIGLLTWRNRFSQNL